ncbi:MAG: pyridoxine 5'-phosphate synthase [Crocinitomicaceae bacterium]|jgi:pyridoxine 5-phosphate synthase|nr:pyridoxine 5'-phosphate synthase [Crocinitomicaceae bacterium]MBT6514371.1 pyridoxine 5'-phosphate synthase [Crocinitomicaceae bacterium]
MTRLSININKVATLRNARGGNVPNVIQVAKDLELYGAQGITVHPRPDERHIRYADVKELASIVTTELNIEGNPKERKFIDLVLETNPTQVTLVPDSQIQLTSDHGWDTKQNKDYLLETLALFKKQGIRTSIFVDADLAMVNGAAEAGADRIELYTESYAARYGQDREHSILDFTVAAKRASELGLGLNAGHDLDRKNLKYFAQNIPNLLEVSIGHAFVADSLYFGLENTVGLYLRELR